MTTVPADAAERLYDLLVAALGRSRTDPFTAPVTVAEIYQELVPYRVVRAEAGFQMNADYEHALLVLLSGAGDRLRLEPVTARDALARELAGPNPNVGRYRDFAACDAWVAPPTSPAAASGARVGDRADELNDVLADDDAAGTDWGGLAALGADVDDESSDAVAAAATFAFDDAPAAPPAAFASAPPEPAAPADARAGQHCAYCDSALPTGRPVRFCPYCGGDQTTQPCVACGEALDPGWVYCVACGAGRTGD